MKDTRQKELLQAGLIHDSCKKICSQPYPAFQENKNFSEDFGYILTAETNRLKSNFRNVSETLYLPGLL